MAMVAAGLLPPRGGVDVATNSYAESLTDRRVLKFSNDFVGGGNLFGGLKTLLQPEPYVQTVSSRNNRSPTYRGFLVETPVGLRHVEAVRA